jgi:hypothetical protein
VEAAPRDEHLRPGKIYHLSKSGRLLLLECRLTHFPCVGCRQDFSQRVGKSRGNLKVRNPSQVNNNDDLIIWLWKLHNDVNQTLMNDQALDSMETWRVFRSEFGQMTRLPREKSSEFYEKNTKFVRSNLLFDKILK